jgi:hypothetical protein
MISKILKIVFSKNVFGVFACLSVLALLASCNGKSQEPATQIQGTFFAYEPVQKILLFNNKGNIQKNFTLKDDQIYKFQLSQKDSSQGPFNIIYTFNDKPSLALKPPFVKILVQDVKQNTVLPAVLVFDFALQSKKLEDNKLEFEWNKPVFSKNPAKITLKARIEEGLLKNVTEIQVAQIPYAETKVLVDLSQKMRGSDLTLLERLKEACKVTWFVELPYDYPEGFSVFYASKPVEDNLCK